jgi:hypothetical protein
MKKLLLLICLIVTQLALAQLSNPGRDDGNIPVIPTQAKPEIISPAKVLSTPKCNCGTSKTGGGWDGIGFYVGDKPLNKYSCGYQFVVKTYEKIKFASGGYNCVATGSDLSCKAIMSGVFYKETTVIRTMSPFNFSTEVLSFTTPGNYKLVLSAKCKSTKCDSCTYYFTVL